MGHFSSRLIRLFAIITYVNSSLARLASWMVIALVVGQAGLVLLRYGVGWGPAWWRESLILFHSLIFMLGAASGLVNDGHVRVDILYRYVKPRTQILIDFWGSLVFLIPFATTLLVIGFSYAEKSWIIREHSREIDGLPAIFLLKSLIGLMSFLLLLQAFSIMIKSWPEIRRKPTLPL